MIGPTGGEPCARSSHAAATNPSPHQLGGRPWNVGGHGRHHVDVDDSLRQDDDG